MTNQQVADILDAQWRLLWPLGDIERDRRLDEVRQDYEFEQTLALVSEQMMEAA